MASLISSFPSRSTWYAVGASLLPVVADQLVRRVFSKKLSDYNLETASLVTGGVTCLLLSRHLPNSFKIGAPILYVAYKAAHYYLSKQTKAVPYSPYLPSHVELLPPQPRQAPANVEKTESPASPQPGVVQTDGPAKPEKTESPVSPQPGVVPTDVPAKPEKTEPLPVPSPAAPTPEEVAARKEAADRTMKALVEAENKALERFHNIIAPFRKSQIMSLKIQIKPLPNAAVVAGEKPIKAETVKAQIRFGSDLVFKLGKTQVEALNNEGCDVTEKTLFFWIDIAGQDNKGATVNFIPLSMLDSLKPNASEFSLCLTEKNYQLILPFKEQQLARLKTLAQTIRNCRKVEVIHTGVVHHFGNPAASSNALEDNDMAGINHARCYLMPFMKKG